MNSFEQEISQIVQEVQRLAAIDSKPTGFCIGNTRKINSTGLYFSPIRKTNRVVAGSAIVYSVEQAVAVANSVDGNVDYILIDTEKKISPELYGIENIGNVERAVRETVKYSRVLTYKGNDLTVDSIESFIVQILSSYPRGLSGKKAAIIGAGNVGSKLALKLVERGMDVVIARRDKHKLDAIVKAINIIKPAETIAGASAAFDNFSAAVGVDLLVGLTQGTPVITANMVDSLAQGAVILDGGKGCCHQDAIALAEIKNVPIYRADIRPGFEAHMGNVFETERIILESLGRSNFNGVSVVSGGLLARKNEVVVDSITAPTAVFGLADGMGDFFRTPDDNQLNQLQIVRNFILNKH
jgi:ribosomal protein S7